MLTESGKDEEQALVVAGRGFIRKEGKGNWYGPDSEISSELKERRQQQASPLQRCFHHRLLIGISELWPFLHIQFSSSESTCSE